MVLRHEGRMQMAGSRMPGKGKRSLWRWFLANRIVRSLAGIVFIIASLPVLYTILYAFPGPTPISTLMAARTIMLKPVDRQWVNLEQVSAYAMQSVIMSEDGQFCFHRGIDLGELKAVIDDALKGEKTRGASTIPMQTVKNLFLWPQRSMLRKAAEIPYAVFANTVWGKRRTLELYLNIAEFGEGIFGIEAASRHYFGRSAANLTLRQAALLATTLPNPAERNPAKPSKLHARLANRVENLARKSGAYIACLDG